MNDDPMESAAKLLVFILIVALIIYGINYLVDGCTRAMPHIK